jgi:hypothetical protein
MNTFENILMKYKIQNITFSNHISYNLVNNSTNLDDQYDFYDYLYYDKCEADKIYSKIEVFKNSKILNMLYKKKHIMRNIISKMFNLKNIFVKGRLDYSSVIVKNFKIVPFEVSRDNVMIFTNQ